MLEAEWTRLVLETWRDFDRFRERAGVVRTSMPILFFGNLRAYLASPIRVLTVGLNPSWAEFPEEEPFRRFPPGEKLVAVAPSYHIRARTDRPDTGSVTVAISAPLPSPVIGSGAKASANALRWNMRLRTFAASSTASRWAIHPTACRLLLTLPAVPSI